jgi:hypothetical protein
MGNLTDYFERIGYKPTWFIGDRVFGYWNKIPFVGTVGNDTKINDIEGPRISIHLDLPIKYEGNVLWLIIATHKDIRSRLKDEEITTDTTTTRGRRKSLP